MKVDIKISSLIFTLIGIVLVIMKFAKVIDWSWLWVLSPFWGQAVVGGIVMVVFTIWLRRQ